MFASISVRLLLWSVAGSCGAFAALAQEAPLSIYEADTRPACSESQLSAWRFAQQNTQGIAARDVRGAWIGTAPAKRRWVGKNWHPIDGYKHTLCGRLHRFGLFAPGALVGSLIGREEADWNNFVIPDPPFRYLIDDVLMFQAPTKQWKECDGQRCIEAEITPPDPLFDNPWFSAPAKRDVSSPLVGQNVCFYGPWVFEEVHHSRPEIHPSELVWWSEPYQGGLLQHMLVVEDDSDRFAVAEDFEPLAEAPNRSSWRPWAASPREAEFLLTFEVLPDSTDHRHFFLQLDPEFSPKVQAAGASPRRRALRFRDRLAVRFEVAESPDLEVSFADVCRRSDGSLQGYVSARTTLGTPDAQEKLFRTIRSASFERAEPIDQFAGFPQHPPRKEHALVARFDPNSLRRVVDDGRPQLLVALELTTTQALQAEASSGGTRRTLSIDPKAEGRPRIDNLSAKDGASVVLRAANDVSTTVEVAPIQLTSSATVRALAANVRPIAPNTDQARSLWQASTALEPSPLEASELRWQRTPVVALQLSAAFAARRSGDAGAGEDSPIADYLNQAIEARSEDALEAYFGADGPYHVEWHYTARNILTGEEVPVELGHSTNPRAVQVEQQGERAEQLQVTFPSSAQALIELTAHAVVTDAYGTKTELKQLLYDHQLTDPDPRRLVAALTKLLARVSQVEPSEWDRALGPDSRLGAAELSAGSRARRVRILHALASQAADDRTVSVSELRRVMALARQLETAEQEK